MRCTPL